MEEKEEGGTHLRTGVRAVGRETAGAGSGHHKDTKTYRKTWRAQGRCLRRATENERKKRRRWENRAEVVTRYLWTRQTVCPSGLVLRSARPRFKNFNQWIRD